MTQYLTYLLIRAVSFPLSFLPFTILQKMGRAFGTLGFYTCRKYRKRAMSNLTLARSLNLTNKERKVVAIEAFQNLMMTLMELSRLLWRPEGFSKLAVCKNSEVLGEAKGVIFLSAHQANWEIGVFDLVPGSQGVTIGRPLANRFLYAWVLRMRERSGNTIVPPQNGLQAGLAALKAGKYFCLVGDQAKVSSDYHSSFLGTRAWSCTSPAVMAYKSGCPICVVDKKRAGGKHLHTYSPLIWPDTTKPWKEDVRRMMDEALALVEGSIKAAPGQWLWQHRRWKQGMGKMKKKYRHDFILLILATRVDISVLDALYPRGIFTALVSSANEDQPLPKCCAKIVYQTEEELFLDDWSFQMVYDFSGVKGVREHYLSLGAFQVVDGIPVV